MIDSCYMGDTRDGLRAMIAAGIRAQTCITSPPYWGLRDYGTAEWDGGADDCGHSPTERADSGERKSSTLGGGTAHITAQEKGVRAFRDECGKCGARRIDKQLGLEQTPAEYVERMVEVFRLVRDVLADDGTLWLNLGDSYGNPSAGRNDGDHRADGAPGGMSYKATGTVKHVGNTIAPKNLVGIPWRVAFALQADGWYLRSDIIWHKPNPMPESVTDRPTKAHEYLFLLAKSERYFYDAAAIAEPFSDGTHASGPNGYGGPVAAKKQFGDRNDAGGTCGQPDRGTRNRRTVWSIATQPYADAHFAVMPRALVEPCVLAGSRVGDVVLDPFLGSGTVAQVAQDLGRRWIGCELNPDYVEMQRIRTAQQGLVLDFA